MHGSLVVLELGGVVVALAVLARVAGRYGIPAIPLYLIAGLAFGEGGVLPLVTTVEFVEIGAQIGLILLLFMLGLEYSAVELVSTMRSSTGLAGLDVGLNLLPGVVAGLALGWSPTEALFLGGVTYPSSSGIVAKLLGDLRRMGNRETPVVLTTLVVEDLVMVAYLPIMGGILVGGSVLGAIGSVSLGIGAVALMLMIAIRAGTRIAALVFHRSDEALLLTLLGLALVVAGAAEALRISAAVGALLVGIMLSGPAAEGARSLLKPLRDLFAAMFFAVFGLSVDPGLLPGALPVAVGLAVVTAATKYVTGYLGSRRSGAGPRGRRRAGLVLIPRGEFSIAIAALAISGGVAADIGPLAAAYVLLLAVTGPLAVQIDDVLGRRAEAVAA